MQIGQILSPERVCVDVPAGSKKSVLERLAKMIADNRPECGTSDVFDSFIARERLGSTGLGQGVAIPHCRVAQVRESCAALIRTSAPVDFDAIDGEPVDLFFALAVPAQSTQEHLDLLASLASMFSDEAFVAELRRHHSAEEVFDRVAGWIDAA